MARRALDYPLPRPLVLLHYITACSACLQNCCCSIVMSADKTTPKVEYTIDEDWHPQQNMTKTENNRMTKDEIQRLDVAQKK